MSDKQVFFLLFTTLSRLNEKTFESITLTHNALPSLVTLALRDPISTLIQQ